MTDPKIEELLLSIREMINQKLNGLKPKLLYTREEAAELLSISVGSLDVLIKRGFIRPRNFGRRLLIPREELERLAKKDLPEIWPEREPKGAGKRIA